MSPSYDHTLHVGVTDDMFERIEQLRQSHRRLHGLDVPTASIVRMLLERGLASEDGRTTSPAPAPGPSVRKTRSKR